MLRVVVTVTQNARARRIENLSRRIASNKNLAR
jgi:hypothetical protein